MQVPEPTVDVGGEDDGASGAGRASNIGPESPRQVAYFLASFNAMLREVRWVVQALRVLMNGCHRSNVHCEEEEGEQCSGAHHGARHGGSCAILAAFVCQLLLRCVCFYSS